MVVTEIGPFEPRYEAGERAIDLVLSLRPSAIIAYNDVMALGLIAQMQRRDIAVGSDVSIIGIDDIWAAQMSAPPSRRCTSPSGSRPPSRSDSSWTSSMEAPSRPSSRSRSRRTSWSGPPPDPYQMSRDRRSRRRWRLTQGELNRGTLTWP